MHTSTEKLREYPSQEEEGLLLEERVTTVKFCIKLLYLDYLVCLFLLRNIIKLTLEILLKIALFGFSFYWLQFSRII